MAQYTKYVKNWARIFAQKVNMIDALEDLEAAALMGLCEAATTFKPAKGVQFTTWYYRRVLWSMQLYAQKAGRPVHDRGKGITAKQQRLAESIEARTGKKATAKELGTTEKRLQVRAGVDLVAYTDLGAVGNQELIVSIRELPRKEQRILAALANGDKRPEIAKRLGVKLADLNEQIEAIRSKLI